MLSNVVNGVVVDVVRSGVLARLVRVAGPTLMARDLWIGAASTLWVAAFAVYLWRYTPWLMAPRADGRDG